MKALRWVLMVLAIVVLAFFVPNSFWGAIFPRNDSEHLQRVAELQDSIRARDTRITTLTTAVQAISVLWSDSAGVWKARQDSARDAAAASRRRASEAAGRLRETLTDDQRVELDAVTEGYERALSAKDRIIDGLERDVRLLVAFKDTAEPLIEEQRDQIADLVEAHDELVSELTAGFGLFGLKVRGTCGPSVTAGMGLKGPDIVGGLGCSVWLARKPDVDRLGDLSGP